jgi:methylthioribose-1-phosphate isomerase
MTDTQQAAATKSILEYETLALDEQEKALVIIDQTKLPGRTELLHLKTQQEIWHAIHELQVRGAPAIGDAAAIGIYLAALEIDTTEYETFYEAFCRAKEYLDSSRPTAVNLSWALNRMEAVVRAARGESIDHIKARLREEALHIKQEDIHICEKLGEYGLSLVKPGDGLLTHCNAGQLATARYGTATAPMYLGHRRGYGFKIFADETRPLLQGARLTAYELQSAGLDVTLICDNMASSVMKNGWIQAVFVGCDRVAANGDAANKIGTSGVAILARHYHIPFYVCAPTSTIDFATVSGEDIHIEQRKPEEVTDMWYRERMAPEGVKVYNPAFDVTEHSLITAIVTEYGIARAPYTESLAQIRQLRQAAGKD